MADKYHLIGIGGIGMSAIAQLLLRQGKQVSGSDLKESKTTDALKRSGVKVSIGHDAANIEGADTVIYSSAIRKDNPEFCAALRKNLVLLRRAEALAGLMSRKSVVAVTGSHGKTTTASLSALLLLNAGLSPSIAVGGILKNIGNNASFGDGDYFVAEADESDGSFLCYHPRYAVITNIDKEHLDHYKNMEALIGAYRSFADNIEEGGCLFYCQEDAVLVSALKGYNKKKVSYGLSEEAAFRAGNVSFNGLSSEYDCIYKGKLLERLHLSLGGMHNVLNSLAVVSLAMEIGISMKVLRETFLQFKGAGRRLEVRFNDGNLMVLDDYAHHPSEIKATLSAVNNLNASRVISVFQPHRFSRTQLLLSEFAGAFKDSDITVITDIYAASEKPLEGVNASFLCEKIKAFDRGKEIIYLAKERILEYLLNIIRPGDTVITMGAGDISKICDELVQRLEGKNLQASRP